MNYPSRWLQVTIETCAADDKAAFAMEKDSLFQGISSDETTISDAINSVDKYSLFEKFCKSGLCRLGLKPLPDVNFKEVWEEAAPFAVCYSQYLIDFTRIFIYVTIRLHFYKRKLAWCLTKLLCIIFFQLYASLTELIFHLYVSIYAGCPCKIMGTPVVYPWWWILSFIAYGFFGL